MKKHWTVTAGSVLALALLAGCGAKGNAGSADSGSGSPAASSGSSASSSTSSSAGTGKQTEITFLYQMDENRPQALWDSIISDFEAQNPDIKVKGSSYPDVAKKNDYIKTLYATGQMPDVTLAGLEDIKLLDGVFHEVPDSISSLFEDTALSKRDGKVYTLPTAKYIMLDMFYNKDIFAKYNLTPPQTWDEFLKLCQTLQDNGVSPMVEAGQAESGYILHNPMMTDMLNEIDPNYVQKLVSGDMKFNGPEVTGIAEKFQELWKKGYYDKGSLSYTDPQKMQAFMDGKAAMVVDGQFNAGQYAEGSKFKVGWFPLPAENSADTYPVMYGDDVGVSAKTKHPDEAFRLVQYLFSDDVYRKIIQPQSATHTTKKDITYDQNYLSTEMNEIAAKLKPVTSFMKIDSFPSGTTELFRTTAQQIAYGGDIGKVLGQMEDKFRHLQEAQQK